VRAAGRYLIVAITIASWIAISNHCALAAAATKASSTQSACPFHSKPAKSQPPSNGVECCKILRAVSLTPAKTPTPAVAVLLHVDVVADALSILLPPKISFAPATLDTGPPGTTSFAELVGSVQSHAPPFLV
jgi:hypothetical protein